MRASLLAGIGLFAGLALLCGGSDRPTVVTPSGPGQVRYTIEGGALTILSHPDYREFRYMDGVVFSGDGITLEAGSLVIEVSYGDLAGRESITLPSPDPGSLERDPSGAAAQLAREIYLPSPELTPEMLRRIQASGEVIVHADEVELHAPGISSSDGGVSWSTTGRAHVSASSPQDSGSLELSADHLSFNTDSQTGQASGNITAKLDAPGQPQISLTAREVQFDALHQRLSASGELRAASGDATMCCGALLVDLTTQELSATGRPRLGMNTRELTIVADELHYNLETQVFTASGGIDAYDGLSGAGLTAEQIEYDAEGDCLQAIGGPRLTQGDSYYTGETLRVTRETGGKLVVEVEGKQSGKINVSKLEQAAVIQ